MKQTHTISPGSNRLRRAFSLVEVLMAVMILSIGLIMVTAVFPVGANWTRQNLEETIGSIIARNAVAIIQTKYTSSDIAPTVTNATFVALPSMTGVGAKLPLSERAYGFGQAVAYPATTPGQALYYWTAIIRKSAAGAGLPAASQNSYDLYIFVFKKGAIEQPFAFPGTGEFANDRDSADKDVPYIALGPLTSTGFIIGSQGVGATSGTVCRQIAPGITNIKGINPDTNYFYAPPPDGPYTVSPLVYIYQTTISF